MIAHEKHKMLVRTSTDVKKMFYKYIETSVSMNYNHKTFMTMNIIETNSEEIFYM